MRSWLLSLVLSATIGSACSGAHTVTAPTQAASSPTPSPAPAATVTLTGRVTESAPTPLTGIDGATVSIADGPNAGRTVTTNPYGYYTITDLQAGAFTVAVTADQYVGTSEHVACANNATSDFQLKPVPKTETHVLTGDIAGEDGTCSDGVAQRPCRIITIPIHNAGPVQATLSWTPSSAADLDLTLFQTGVAAPIARSATTGSGPEELSVTLPAGATYEFRITYAAGKSRVSFTLTVTHMN